MSVRLPHVHRRNPEKTPKTPFFSLTTNNSPSPPHFETVDR